VAVDHVDDLEFFVVQVHGGGGAAIVQHDDAEAFVG
jgi:hypothetical protein